MNPLVPPVADAIPFVDLSSHDEDDQHQIDWPTLATYLLSVHPEAGAIIKMSQGDWYLNPDRHRQRWGAHAAGLKNVGLYHYVELVSGRSGKPLSGADNADALLKAVGDDGGIVAGEFFAGDWEDQSAGPTADLDAAALDFGGRILRPTALAPLLYSANWYAAPHNLERDPNLARFELWWASYQDSIPPVPEPWASTGKGIACWQFTTDARLPGLPWPVDVSWWLAGIARLRAIQWVQPDPLAGKPAVGTPDVPQNTDAPTAIKAALTDLKKSPPDVATAIADLDRALTAFGLVGA